jgi:signal transduction histidine kinase
VGALLTSRNFLRRIDRINDASRTIMAGNLAERMPVSGSGDEIDRLSDNLNQMLDQISRLMTGMKEVSSNVAHDLAHAADPAARPRRGRAAVLSLQRPTAPRSRPTSPRLMRCLNTFNALLSIARAEAGHVRQGFQDTDLVPLVEDLVELYGPIAEEEGGQVELALPASCNSSRSMRNWWRRP